MFFSSMYGKALDILPVAVSPCLSLSHVLHFYSLLLVSEEQDMAVINIKGGFLLGLLDRNVFCGLLSSSPTAA